MHTSADISLYAQSYSTYQCVNPLIFSLVLVLINNLMSLNITSTTQEMPRHATLLTVIPTSYGHLSVIFGAASHSLPTYDDV